MAYQSTDRTKQQKDTKKKLILKTAADILSVQGYHNTTVKDITDKARISVGTFYLYFRNKEDLLVKLYDGVALRLDNAKNYALAKVADNAAVRLTNVYAANLWTYQRHKELTKIMMIEAVGLNPRFEEKYTDLMLKACDSMNHTLIELKELGIIEVPDTKAAAIAHEGIFHYTIAYWLRSGDINLKELAFPLAVFALQALKIDYQTDQIKKSMDDMFQELDQLPPSFFSQCEEYYDLLTEHAKEGR